LKANQTIEARVAEVLSSRRVTLIIQGKKVSARTYVPLNPGEKIRLQVSQAGAHPIFKLLDVEGDGAPHSSRALWHILGKNGPYGRLAAVLANPGIADTDANAPQRPVTLERMEELVKSLSVRSSRADPDFLRTLIKGSGLAWEYKLSREIISHRSILMDRLNGLADGDLKALAIRGVAGRHQEGDEVRRNLQSFLEGLEKLQMLNRLATEASGRCLLPLPVWFGGGWKFGQLLLDTGGKAKNRERPEDRLVKISFLLEMSNMGHVRADFALFKHMVNGSFSVGDEDTCSWVQKSLPDLVAKLKQHGFEVPNIDCHVIRAETLASASLMDKIVGRDEVGLNLVI
jgi:hypothetical protein